MKNLKMSTAIHQEMQEKHAHSCMTSMCSSAWNDTDRPTQTKMSSFIMSQPIIWAQKDAEPKNIFLTHQPNEYYI